MKQYNHHIKQSRFFLGLISFGIIVSFWACANIVPLSGGAKDTKAPSINMDKSTKNFQTGVYTKEFRFEFDEWIVLKDKSQIIISPPLKYVPKISSVGKRVNIELDDREVLRENTTYVIQLGKSVKDYTESNIISGFNHVFSTGDHIDSLEIVGKVIDAFTGEPMKGVSVMLHESAEDSVIYKERPYYVAITENSGNFHFRNIRSGDFRLIALEDNNLNLMYDPASEKIGFIDTLIHIDSIKRVYNFDMFSEVQPLKVANIEQEKDGFLTIIFNNKIDDIDYSLSRTISHQSMIRNDSLLLWYKPDTLGELSLYVLEDTIKIRKPKKIFEKLVAKNSRKKIVVHPEMSYELGFQQWLTNIDTSFINLLDTGKNNLVFEADIDSIDHSRIWINTDWKEGQQYKLEFLPGAITDFFGLTNDSIDIDIQIGRLEDYGTINLMIVGLDSTFDYKIDLYKKDEFIDSYMFKDKSTNSQHVFTKLLEGDYKIEILEDRDMNGRWSPGNYLKKTKSEKTLSTSTGELRKNWDLEVEVDFNPRKTKTDTMAVDSILINGEIIDSTNIDKLEINKNINTRKK